MSTETKHTPGPWIHGKKDETYRNGDRIVWTSKGSGYGAIAEASGYQNIEEAAANARLIAASPDLLASCRELLAKLADWACVSVDEYASETAVGRRAIAAISKATTGANQNTSTRAEQ